MLCHRQDYSVVSGQLVELLADNVGQHSEQWTEYVLRDPILFGDYRNALESDVPRLYEDMQDYDASKALFQEVRTRVVGFGAAVHSFIHSLDRSIIHVPIHMLDLLGSFGRLVLFVCLLVHACIHSFIHSFISFLVY